MNRTLQKRGASIAVEAREGAIFKYLKELPQGEGATIREIWEAVREELDDDVTVQAYHKLIDRLEAEGKLDIIAEEPTPGKLYAMAPHLHADNPVTLDDIYEYMTLMAPSDAIAQAIDAVDYLEEKKATVLKAAACALLEEEPVALFLEMIKSEVRRLKAELEVFKESQLRDPKGRQEDRLKKLYNELEFLLYRWLSIPPETLDITPVEKVLTFGGDWEIVFNPDDSGDLKRLEDVLSKRVFGETFIREIDVKKTRNSRERQRMAVAGTDGSTYSSHLDLTTARRFMEESGSIITFNTSLAYLEEAPHSRGDIPYPYHSVPMTKEELNHPSNRGMILSPFMFPSLSESEYEHTVKCATDVVQFRIDANVFCGKANSISPVPTPLFPTLSVRLPPPKVHIRDGTVTPQERYFSHYGRKDVYGEFVKDGIILSREILEKIKYSKKPQVFAGAAKSTQLRIFSKLLNWYIAHGSKKKFGEPIDPNWEGSTAARVSDNHAMTALLSTLENRNKEGKFYVTCVVVRQFHSLTEYYNVRLGGDDWVTFFEQELEDEMRRYQRRGGTVPYLATIDLENDPFVYMCKNADYGLFYIGHTGGEPPPTLPRYEFLDSLRDFSSVSVKKARARVDYNVKCILEALDQTGLDFDRDHNFLTNQQLVKVIPYVVQHAHETCKSWGRQLQSEFKSMVVASLREIKRARWLKSSDVELLPVSVRKYMERYVKAIEEEIKADPGRFIR